MLEENLLESLVVQYLDDKGLDRPAKQMRANSRIAENKSSLRMVSLYEWFESNMSRFGKVEVKEVAAPATSGGAGAGGAGAAAGQSAGGAGGKKRSADDVYGKAGGGSGACNRVFIGNLSFKVDEEAVKTALADCGEVTSITWITDKETGRFYGTAFLEFDTPEAATAAATTANGRAILGRECKIALAPPKQSDAQDERRKMPPMPKLSDKPLECRKLFMGNLAFDVTEEDIRATFKDCGEIREVRFQLRANGEFKGCGFIEFTHEYSVLDAVKKHGKPIKNRPVRLDWD